MRNFILLFICFLLAVACSGCRTHKGAGIKSLDEARILAAVNAERNRWLEELSGELVDGLSEVEHRISLVDGGLQQITVAAQEYRRFVLNIIERLSEAQNTE